MKQLKTRIIVGTSMLLESGRNMYKRGEITQEQFAEMQRRADNVPEEWKKTEITITEAK